jgi:hypothetical protein
MRRLWAELLPGNIQPLRPKSASKPKTRAVCAESNFAFQLKDVAESAFITQWFGYLKGDSCPFFAA